MSKIRVGIIGCGEVTQIMHLHSLYQFSDLFDVTALCDASRSVVDAVGALWNIPKRYTDERELIAQNDVDAVLIATPNHFHAVYTILAAQAGKHVMVEKPMCITLREADEVAAATRQHNIVVQVAYMRRYALAFVDACKMVREMGGVRVAQVHDVIGQNAFIISKTSRVMKANDIPADTLATSRTLETRLFEEALGEHTPEIKRMYGLLLGLASHDTSAMREMFGMPRGVLYAAQRNGGNYITAALDYGDFVCHVEIGVNRIPRYDTFLAAHGDTQVIQVQYDAPYVRNLPTRLIVTRAEDGRVTHEDTNPGWSDNFTLEWQAFYDNIQQQRAPKTSPEDFRQDLELFLDMVRLART